jgi:hypothetical protein
MWPESQNDVTISGGENPSGGHAKIRAAQRMVSHLRR